MGRHSAPDDDEDVDAAAIAVDERAADELAHEPGRHTSSEAATEARSSAPSDGEDVSLPALLNSGDEASTLVIGAGAPEQAAAGPAGTPEPVLEEDDARPVEDAAGGSEPGRDDDAAASPAPRKNTGTRADLRVLREHPALRVRCSIALVVPFVLELIVLIVLGRAGDYLLWIWIPAIVAGVAVGSLLDAAHRAAAAPPEPDGIGAPHAETAPPGRAAEPDVDTAHLPPVTAVPSSPTRGGEREAEGQPSDEESAGDAESNPGGPPGGATLSVTDTARMPAVGREDPPDDAGEASPTPGEQGDTAR